MCQGRVGRSSVHPREALAAVVVAHLELGAVAESTPPAEGDRVPAGAFAGGSDSSECVESFSPCGAPDFERYEDAEVGEVPEKDG